MSRPDKRGEKLSAPGAIDEKLGEFWVENPWEIANKHNLSNNERQRFFLNLGGKGFLDVSFLSGADPDFDGRAVVAGDFRNTGQLDVVVRHSGSDGAPLVIYENQLPRRNYLMVSLKGVKSNRQGIGARLVAKVNGQQIVRELFPANTYFSQMPTIVHFGLGEAETVESLSIRWPSGTVQELTNVAGNRHVLIHEDKSGDAAVQTVVPGEVGAAR